MPKLQYFGYRRRRDNSVEKTVILGKIEGMMRRGRQRMRWLNGIINSMDMSLSKLVKDREVLGASVRNSTHDKGREEGGFGICKGGIEPQETPCSQASTPKTGICLLYLRSHLHL